MNKNLIIIGAGTAGTMMANKLHHELRNQPWHITLIDRDNTHYYQPGFLFIPFGIYKPEDVVRPRTDFIPEGVRFIMDEVQTIDGEQNLIRLQSGDVLTYDVLIIATGVEIAPLETPGLKGELWYKDIFDFYTYDGAVRLA